MTSPTLTQITAAASQDVPINENFAAISPAALYSRRYGSGISGLVLGYYGGTFEGNDVADGTTTLAASQATIYVVALRSTGAVSSSTSTTNWNDAISYFRIGIATTGTATITAFVDKRQVFSTPTAGDVDSVNGQVGIVTLDTDEIAEGSTNLYLTTERVQDIVGSFVIAGTNITVAYNDGLNTLTIASTAASVAGADKQIQYNNGGTALGAEAGFEYDQSTNTLTVPNATTTGLSLTAASTTGSAGFRVPHGSAPTSPTNGDFWSTTSGFYGRVNGATVGPFATGGGSGLTNWTESISTANPNGTISAARFIATSAQASTDAVFSPKGSGSVLSSLPDNAASGGNKRGNLSVDLQLSRAAAAQVASGLNSTISGGINNTASGDYSSIPGGEVNTASGQNSFCAGRNNTVSSLYSHALGASNISSATASFAQGQLCTADGANSVASGSQSTTRGIEGAMSRASGQFSAKGDAQVGTYVLRVATSNATPAVLCSNGSAAGTTNQVVLPNTSTYKVRIEVVARSSTDSVGFSGQGVISRGANAAATSVNAAITLTAVGATGGAGTWTATATADTTNGALAITGTGAAATNIKWVATVETVEVVG